MSQVADLLAQSRAAHAAYRRSAGRINKEGKVSEAPNLWAAGSQVQQALSLRLEAHVLDPEHVDPVWIADQHANKGASHDAMVAFLGRYLTPVEARA